MYKYEKNVTFGEANFYLRTLLTAISERGHGQIYLSAGDTFGDRLAIIH